MLFLILIKKHALEAFRLSNPSKQLYIDFIYGALLKMKDFNAHTHLEAYRKLMEIFPIGKLILMNIKKIHNVKIFEFLKTP